MFDLSSELQFQTSRSSGPGGQNVNKVESKVEVRLNIPASQILNEEQKQKIQQRLKSQLTTEGDLIITSQESRSQVKNKELAVKKLYTTLAKAFEEPRVRKATKPTRASTLQRLQTKRVASERKASRSRKNWED